MISLGPKNATIVGLDISTSSLKVIELKPAGKHVRMHRCAFRPLPPGAVVDNLVKDVDGVSQAIRDLFQEARITGRKVATSVSGGTAIIKIIQVANMTELDLEDQISLEAEEYIPFDIADVQLDFQIIRPAAKGEDMMDVLLAACKKEMIQNHVQTIEAAGLQVSHFEMDLFALTNAFERFLQPPGSNPDECVGLINIGASLTNFCILRRSAPLFTRDLPYGGNQLTEDGMRRFNASREEVLAMQESTQPSREFTRDVLGPFLDQLTLQLTHTLDFHHNNNPTLPVQNIYLTGGCAMIPGIDAFLSRRLGIPVTVADPFAKLQDSKKFPPFDGWGPRMMVALGLALRGVDP